MPSAAQAGRRRSADGRTSSCALCAAMASLYLPMPSATSGCARTASSTVEYIRSLAWGAGRTFSQELSTECDLIASAGCAACCLPSILSPSSLRIQSTLSRGPMRLAFAKIAAFGSRALARQSIRLSMSLRAGGPSFAQLSREPAPLEKGATLFPHGVRRTSRRSASTGGRGNRCRPRCSCTSPRCPWRRGRSPALRDLRSSGGRMGMMVGVTSRHTRKSASARPTSLRPKDREARVQASAGQSHRRGARRPRRAAPATAPASSRPAASRRPRRGCDPSGSAATRRAAGR